MSVLSVEPSQHRRTPRRGRAMLKEAPPPTRKDMHVEKRLAALQAKLPPSDGGEKDEGPEHPARESDAQNYGGQLLANLGELNESFEDQLEQARTNRFATKPPRLHGRSTFEIIAKIGGQVEKTDAEAKAKEVSVTMKGHLAINPRWTTRQGQRYKNTR